ncbi:hypothetical protein D1P53_006336 [Cryptococcus gattii VGV]|nr:hypothetical protein D1P53_006336 [Cryptococcus gattii VGV]
MAGQSSTATASEHLGSAIQANQQSVTPDIVITGRKRKKRSGNSKEDGAKIKKTRQSREIMRWYLKRIGDDREVESNGSGKSIPSTVGSSKFNSKVPATISRAPPPSQTILRGTLPMMTNNTSPEWQATLAMTMPTTHSAHAGHCPPPTMSISSSSSPTAQTVTAPLGLSPLRSRSYLPASLTLPSTVAGALFGQNYVAILTLRAHEEGTYAKLGNIEGILLRRMFWLMYGADKTLAFTGAFPAFFHEDDCASVALPEDIDDEYLTEEGYIKQPESYTSVLSGFRYISHLYRVSGEVLDKRRRDRLRSPSGLMLQMRINEINELHNRTMSIMDLCPAPLKLDYRSASASVKPMSPDWDERIKSEIHTIFFDPNKYDMDLVKDFYLVQQANIYITQQLVRFTIIQYREDLLKIQLDDMHHELDLSQRETMKRSIREQAQDERDEVVVDMLSILQKIPIQVLAVNSFSIIDKVRFVASSLLDFLNHDEGIGLIPPSSQETRAQRAQRNLWKFLNYLLEIESMYSWDDEKVTT